MDRATGCSRRHELWTGVPPRSVGAHLSWSRQAELWTRVSRTGVSGSLDFQAHLVGSARTPVSGIDTRSSGPTSVRGNGPGLLTASAMDPSARSLEPTCARGIGVGAWSSGPHASVVDPLARTPVSGVDTRSPGPPDARGTSLSVTSLGLPSAPADSYELWCAEQYGRDVMSSGRLPDPRTDSRVGAQRTRFVRKCEP